MVEYVLVCWGKMQENPHLPETREGCKRRSVQDFEPVFRRGNRKAPRGGGERGGPGVLGRVWRSDSGLFSLGEPPVVAPRAELQERPTLRL